MDRLTFCKPDSPTLYSLDKMLERKHLWSKQQQLQRHKGVIFRIECRLTIETAASSLTRL